MLPITFLTDYGYRDEYAGVCHGVIEQIAPGTQVIDITHGIPAGDVVAGALALKRALPFLPRAVHLAVVDPDVGTDRRALALRARNGSLFVGPDNGLLMPACEQTGGVEVAVDLSGSPHALKPVSATFHGRDLFAPLAARLAADFPIEFTGEPIAPDSLVTLQLTAAQVADGRIEATVATIDGFGNLQLDGGIEQLELLGAGGGQELTIETGDARHTALYGEKFADAKQGGLVVYLDSSGSLAIAVKGGSAARLLGAEPNSTVAIVS